MMIIIICYFKLFCFKLFLDDIFALQQKDFINDSTMLHKLYNLINFVHLGKNNKSYEWLNIIGINSNHIHQRLETAEWEQMET